MLAGGPGTPEDLVSSLAEPTFQWEAKEEHLRRQPADHRLGVADPLEARPSSVGRSEEGFLGRGSPLNRDLKRTELLHRELLQDRLPLSTCLAVGTTAHVRPSWSFP